MATFRQKLGRWLTKSSTGSVLIKLFGLSGPDWMQQDYRTYAQEGYGGNPYVYACINEIATAAAGIPWQVKRRDNDADKPDTILSGERDSDLVRLTRRPDKRAGWAAWIKRLTTYLYLDGNAFIRALTPEQGARIIYLTLMRPDYVTVQEGADGVKLYRYEPAGAARENFTDEDILHLQFVNPLNELRGMSPMKPAARSVDMNNQGREWNQGLLKNQARPPGAFSVKGELSPDAAEAVRKELDEKISGYLNAGRPLVLQGDTEWINFGYNPTEMDWLAGLDLSAREICAAFNVPEELVGGPRKTYANYGEARKSLYTETVLPLLDMYKDEFNAWLTPKVDLTGALYLDYDKSAIEALSEDASAIYKREVDAWWHTIDEHRAATGKPPIDGGATLLVPAAVMPLESVSAPTRPLGE